MLQAEKTCFLIADISGYTEYLAGVEIDHAQDILADLINTVVTSLQPNFQLSKLEGDAAFCVSPADTVDGSIVLDTIERCYFGFRRRRRDVGQATSCECNACTRIPNLNLKFVAHSGLAIRQSIAGHEELLGSDVIAVHRLLKNEIVDDTGIAAYAAFTDRLVQEMGIDAVEVGMVEHAETYEHLGEMKLWVHDLDRRWQEEDMRQRVYIGPHESGYSVKVKLDAPPQVVWELITIPRQRLKWQTGATAIDQDTTPGGRRGVGMVNHCIHGADAIVEEILDWRPFDYYTNRSKMFSDGPSLVETVELEPTPDGGTITSFRFERPQSDADKAWLDGALPELDEAFRAGLAILEKEARDQAAERVVGRLEPPLPQPRNVDGFLAGIKPIEIIG